MDKKYFKCSIATMMITILCGVVFVLPYILLFIFVAFAPLNYMIMLAPFLIAIGALPVIWWIIALIFAIIDYKKRRDSKAFILIAINLLIIVICFVLPRIWYMY